MVRGYSGMDFDNRASQRAHTDSQQADRRRYVENYDDSGPESDPEPDPLPPDNVIGRIAKHIAQDGNGVRRALYSRIVRAQFHDIVDTVVPRRTKFPNMTLAQAKATARAKIATRILQNPITQQKLMQNVAYEVNAIKCQCDDVQLCNTCAPCF
jgi:hypothetical protein